MDKLDTIFYWQNRFDSDLMERRQLNGKYTPCEWIQKETLALISELAELLDEVNFKWWKNERPVDMDCVKEELVDILHFFVSMCLKAGMDADELARRYMDKNKENFDRQNGLSQKTGYETRKDSE